MILTLPEDGGKVFINPAHVLYVAPVDEDTTLVMLVGSNGFVVVEQFEHVVALTVGSGPF